MLAEIGAFEALMVVTILVIWLGTFAEAARRGRWGWCVFIFLVSGLAILAFWIVNPRPIDRGPRPA